MESAGSSAALPAARLKLCAEIGLVTTGRSARRGHLLASAAAAEESRQQARPARLRSAPVVVGAELPRSAGGDDTFRVRVTPPPAVAFGRDEHVLAPRVNRALAQGAAVRRRLEILGGSNRPPARLVEWTHHPSRGRRIGSRPGGWLGAGRSKPGGIGSVAGASREIVTVPPWWPTWSGSPSSNVYVASCFVTSTFSRRPRKTRRKASRSRRGGRRGANVSSPSWSRMPPKPPTAAIQAPASEAMWTPSRVLCSRSRRSRKAASPK